MSKIKLLGSKTFSTKWTVENFSNFYHQEIRYPFIYSDNISKYNNLEAYLELCPKGEDESSQNYISVFLNFETYEQNIKIFAEISFVDSDGNNCFLRENECLVDTTLRCGWKEYISQNFLNNLENKLLYDDKIVIYSKIQIKEFEKNEIIFPLEKMNLQTKKFTNNWSIPNFKTLLITGEKSLIRSPRFSPTSLDEYEFEIVLYPFNEIGDNVSIFLRLIRGENHRVAIRFLASILNENNEKFYSKENQWIILLRETCGWNEFISHKKIIDFKNVFSKNDDLVIFYEIEIVDESNFVKTDDDAILNEIVSNAELSLIPFTHKCVIENFTKYLLQENMELKSVETKSFFWPINDSVEFFLRLETMNNYLSVFLWLLFPQKNNVTIFLRMSILDNLGNKFTTMGCKVTLNSESIDNWGWDLISIEDLKKNLDYLLLNDKFEILCEIESINKPTKTENLESPNWFFWKAKLSKYLHTWTIENFNFFLSDNLPSEAAICSENFAVPNNDLQFYLKLYPKLNEKALIYICCASCNDHDVIVSYRFSIGKFNKNEKLSRGILKRGNESNEIPMEITQKDLVNLFEDKLIIYCEINAIEALSYSPSELSDYYHQVERVQLSNHLMTQSFTDRSNFNPKIFAFEWTIESVAQKIVESNFIASNKLKFSECDGVEFNFRLCLANKDEQEFVSLYLDVTSLDQKTDKVTILWKISILDFNGDKENSKEGRWQYILNDPNKMSTWGWSKWISSRELFDECNGFLNQDKLILSITGEMFKVDPTENVFENHSKNNIGSNEVCIYKNLEDSLCYTKISKIIHYWTVENFSYFLDTTHDKHPCIESTIFSILFNENIQLKIEFFPFSSVDDCKDFVALYLFLASDDQNDIIVQYKLSILNKNGVKFKTLNGKIKFIKGKSNGQHDILLRKDLFDSNNELLTEDKLTISGEIYLVQFNSTAFQFTKFAIDDFTKENWKVIPLNDITTKHFSHTQLPKFNVNQKWTIEDFIEKSHQNLNKFSEKFCEENNKTLQFNLKLIQNAELHENEIAIYLCLDYQIENEIKLRFKLSLLDKEEQNFDLRENKIKLLINEESFEHVEYFSLKSILNCAHLLREGCLTVFCEVDIVHEHKTIALETDIQRNTCILENLNHYLYSYQPADIVLDFKKSKTNLFAHKSILCARSKYFAGMFTHETVENQENLVTIKDFDCEVGLELLKYLYTGKIQRMEQFAVEYFIASDMYDLQELHIQSEEWISAHKTIQNACSLMILAYTYNSDNLKLEIFNYIHKNVGIISETEDFINMAKNYPNLMIELYLNLTLIIKDANLVVSVDSNVGNNTNAIVSQIDLNIEDELENVM